MVSRIRCQAQCITDHAPRFRGPGARYIICEGMRAQQPDDHHAVGEACLAALRTADSVVGVLLGDCPAV